MFDWLKFADLWFQPIGTRMHAATRFSLITFSYGHRIPPQGEVQPECSSYDNIIVRNVKGQTAVRLVLQGLCWDDHRWLRHCCRAPGEWETCQPEPPPGPLSFPPLAPAGKRRAAGYVRAPAQKCLAQQKRLRTLCLRCSRSISE